MANNKRTQTILKQVITISLLVFGIVYTLDRVIRREAPRLLQQWRKKPTFKHTFEPRTLMTASSDNIPAPIISTLEQPSLQEEVVPENMYSEQNSNQYPEYYQPYASEQPAYYPTQQFMNQVEPYQPPFESAYQQPLVPQEPEQSYHTPEQQVPTIPSHLPERKIPFTTPSTTHLPTTKNSKHNIRRSRTSKKHVPQKSVTKPVHTRTEQNRSTCTNERVLRSKIRFLKKMHQQHSLLFKQLLSILP